MQSRRGSDAIRHGKWELNRLVAIVTVSRKRLHTVDLTPRRVQAHREMRGLFGLFRRLAMSFKHSAASRLLALSALASVALTTGAQAQMYGQGQRRSGRRLRQHDGRQLGLGNGFGNGRCRRDRRTCARFGRSGYRRYDFPPPNSITRVPRKRTCGGPDASG